MVAARRQSMPAPPPRQTGPIIHGSSIIQHWLAHYWQKLQLPRQELNRVAITQDRQEYMRWTGKRLNVMVLGCYCYLAAPPSSQSSLARSRSRKQSLLQKLPFMPADPQGSRASGVAGMDINTLPGFGNTAQLHLPGHRHLIFIEPEMEPKSIEVTVAHELIHL